MILWIAVGFLFTELFSAWLHRVVFHGILWKIHQTHHSSNKSHKTKLELNDWFAFGFSGLACVFWLSPIYLENSLAVHWGQRFQWFGAGITAYGIAYFIVHDIWTHRRFFSRSKNPGQRFYWIRKVIHGHRKHHRATDKKGRGPYGLFFPF